MLLVVLTPLFPRTWIRLEITSLMNVGLCCLHDVVQKKEWKSLVWNYIISWKTGGQWSGYDAAKRSTPVKEPHSLAIRDSSAPAPAASPFLLKPCRPGLVPH